jgi:hypothetical protein
MKPSRANVLEIVEAIYREEKSERAWLDAILVAARPALDHGLGVCAYPFELTGREIRTPWAKVRGATRDVGPAMILTLMATTRRDAQVSESVRAAPPCATASELGLADRAGFDILKKNGIRDLSGVTGFDTTGHAVFLGGFLPRQTQLDPAFRARFDRVAAHLGVGLRYRHLAKSARRRRDAVFSPSAKLLHAEGDATLPRAREALSRAVVAIDKARGGQRRTDPDGASWRGKGWSARDGRSSMSSRATASDSSSRERMSPTRWSWQRSPSASGRSWAMSCSATRRSSSPTS